MEILSALAAEMGRLSELINRARGEISLLREYRTSLIADVVTGKLDVREAAARLPDEAGDEVVLDDHEPVAEDEDESIGVDPDADLEED
jgi:type I restriction enzyme S subunit